MSASRWFRRHLALPDDHGSWVLLLGPLAVGAAVAPGWSGSSAYFLLACLCAFLARQPIAVAVKAAGGRRSREALGPAGVWIALYAVGGAASALALVLRGCGFVLPLALPALPVLAWQMALVARRAERRRLGLELAGAGTLSLAATGAYWVGAGTADPVGGWLAPLTFAQSASAIAHAYLRLTQRELARPAPWPERLALGRGSLIWSLSSLAAVAGLGQAGLLPRWLFAPYAVQALESLRGVARPALGLRPRAIGWRQLAVSVLFSVLFVLFWRLGPRPG